MSDAVSMMDARGEVPRANPQHVQWLNEGVESWNRRRKEVPFKPELARIVVNEEVYKELKSNRDWYTLLRSPEDLSGVDLSGADLRGAILSKGVFRGADFTGADLSGASAFISDFRMPDFTCANFESARISEFVTSSVRFEGAKFNGAILRNALGDTFSSRSSDFTCADLSGSDLTGADFFGSNFRDANLADTDLSGTRLEQTILSSTRLHGARLWKAKLFDQDWFQPGFDARKAFEQREVNSVHDLAKLRVHLLDFYKNEFESGLVVFYFRGEPCTRMSLRPTVMRGGLRRFERDLLVGLKTEFPAAFAGHHTAIDELAIARHFGLPTRLLDVTRNPMVGAFWATGECKTVDPGSRVQRVEGKSNVSGLHPHESCDGRLHVFVIPRTMVCTYDSDRVTIVANFARLPLLQQERILTKRHDDIEFDYIGSGEVAFSLNAVSMGESKAALLHNIRREKPYFADQIDVRDFFRVFVVEPRRSFERIRAQSGAFMLSALHERLEGQEVTNKLTGARLYDHYELTVPADKKDEVREELDWFGINAPRLYADVETASGSVASRFRELAERHDSPSEALINFAWRSRVEIRWES